MARTDNSPVAIVLAVLRDEAGLKAVVDSGKHYKVRFWVAGRRCTYVVPRTTSDHRAAMNARAGIRRYLRERGVKLRS